jgi:hypothetical protein
MSKYYMRGEIEVHPQEGTALIFAFVMAKAGRIGNCLRSTGKVYVFGRGGGDARELKGEGPFQRIIVYCLTHKYNF